MLKHLFKNDIQSCFRFFIFIYLISGLCTKQVEAAAVSSRCRNPNGHWGACVSIFECDSLLNILRYGLAENYRFVRQSRCQQLDAAENAAFVCCTADTTFTVEKDRIIFPDESVTLKEQQVHEKPLDKNDNDDVAAHDNNNNNDDKINKKAKFPKPPECGALTIETKIYGGMEAELTEFSWMVNLEYLTANGDVVSVCAGSLINDRYVLTAAHCITGIIQKKIGEIISVRLGDHNTAQEIDCNSNGCLDPYKRVGIEKIIVHENFGDDRQLKIHQHNDIALLRLNEKIIFSNSIQPVCLPNVEEVHLENGMQFTVAGWGHNSTVSGTSEKRKVKVPFVDQETCRQSYLKRAFIPEEQLCAGGVYRQDSCSGDSGGPLMHLSSKKYVWILDGIVSFGRGCGLETPSVYTRVSSYLDWIEQNTSL